MSQDITELLIDSDRDSPPRDLYANWYGMGLSIYVPPPWEPVYYFFYGSLMDDRKLTQVLRLDSPPVLKPAFIIGFSIKMWGPYPALIAGPPGNVVNGMAYEVRQEDHVKRLAYYETDAYRCAPCLIRPGSGGGLIFGKTFLWANGPNHEDLSPGSFDIEAWKKAHYGSG